MPINLDYAASGYSFNPSAIHAGGRTLYHRIEESREQIAKVINAQPEEIFFTSGGTESNNWAIKGVALANAHKGKHIITSQIEHPSVLESCRYLERHGFTVTYLPVDSNGVVDPMAVKENIRYDTILISIMGLNNEVGSFQDMQEIGGIAREYGVLYHADCIQQAAAKGFDVVRDNLDLASVSGHKFGARPGTGFLYVRKGTNIDPLIHGGHQQGGMRAGTEAVKLTSDLAWRFVSHRAFMSSEDIKGRMICIAKRMLAIIKDIVPDARLNGAPIGQRAANNLNICFPGVDGEALAMYLSAQGVYISRGSACSAGEYKPSHVLKAIGLSDEDAMCSVRISMSPNIMKSEAYAGAQKIAQAVQVIREVAHGDSEGFA